jgi:hypothetical protein
MQCSEESQNYDWRKFYCTVLRRGQSLVIEVECLIEDFGAEIPLRHNDYARALAFSQLLERALRRGNFRATSLAFSHRI